MEGHPEDMNLLVLVALSKHLDSLEGPSAERRFVELLPVNSPCIPFESDGSSAVKHQTAIPKELYLATSDLSAFAGVGVFHKVSKRLTKAGVSDAFLVAMGVVSNASPFDCFSHKPSRD